MHGDHNINYQVIRLRNVGPRLACSLISESENKYIRNKLLFSGSSRNLSYMTLNFKQAQADTPLSKQAFNLCPQWCWRWFCSWRRMDLIGTWLLWSSADKMNTIAVKKITVSINAFKTCISLQLQRVGAEYLQTELAAPPYTFLYLSHSSHA